MAVGVRGRRVTVLGAGVAGLAVARALALRGARVQVLEQADAIREVGAGLQVSPNGAVVLRALGLGGALQAVSTRGAAVELRDGYSGSLVARLDLERAGGSAGFHFLHRADLIEILRKGAEEAGAEIRLLTRAASVDLTNSRPRLVLETGAEDAEILIGADGLHSVTRGALMGPEAPFFTHQVAWRAVIPGDDGPAVAEVHMGAGRHLVSYPLRGGALRNIVAVEERKRWVEESWSLRDDPLDLRSAFESFGPKVQGWLEQVEGVWLWGLFRHDVARIWQRAMASGGVAILGDAAHPTLPFLAQGACMALEDAWALADSLDRASGLAEGLVAYETRRQERCRRIVAAAGRNARAYHLSGLMREIAHLGLRIGGVLSPGLALSRFDWLYQYDVTEGAGAA